MPSLDQIEQFRNKQGVEIIELVGETSMKAHQFSNPRVRTKLGFVEQATRSLIESYKICIGQAEVITAEIGRELK